MPENFSFENTVHLVQTGIYRYVRHPMYGSLLLLTWGACCKHFAPLSLVFSCLITVFLIATAKSEELENVRFFGDSYRSYAKQSKMFIPYVL
jgi:protein-S-isoprenylcysteine O-methyltransferase Ste14